MSAHGVLEACEAVAGMAVAWVFVIVACEVDATVEIEGTIERGSALLGDELGAFGGSLGRSAGAKGAHSGGNVPIVTRRLLLAHTFMKSLTNSVSVRHCTLYFDFTSQYTYLFVPQCQCTLQAGIDCRSRYCRSWKGLA